MSLAILNSVTFVIINFIFSLLTHVVYISFEPYRKHSVNRLHFLYLMFFRVELDQYAQIFSFFASISE